MPNITLKKMLEARGMSPRELCNAANIREGTFYAILNNEIKRLPVEAIDSICEILNCDPGDWIKRSNSKNKDID